MYRGLEFISGFTSCRNSSRWPCFLGRKRSEANHRGSFVVLRTLHETKHSSGQIHHEWRCSCFFLSLNKSCWTTVTFFWGGLRGWKWCLQVMHCHTHNIDKLTTPSVCGSSSRLFKDEWFFVVLDWFGTGGKWHAPSKPKAIFRSAFCHLNGGHVRKNLVYVICIQLSIYFPLGT